MKGLNGGIIMNRREALKSIAAAGLSVPVVYVISEKPLSEKQPSIKEQRISVKEDRSFLYPFDKDYSPEQKTLLANICEERKNKELDIDAKSHHIQPSVDVVEKHHDFIMGLCSKYHINPLLAIGVAVAECGGRENAVSSARARGIYQIKPEAASEMGINTKDTNWGYEPEQNITAGIHRLVMLQNGLYYDIDGEFMDERLFYPMGSRTLFYGFGDSGLVAQAYHDGPRGVQRLVEKCIRKQHKDKGEKWSNPGIAGIGLEQVIKYKLKWVDLVEQDILEQNNDESISYVPRVLACAILYQEKNKCNYIYDPYIL